MDEEKGKSVMGSISQDHILSLARSFMECRILLSGAELNIFTILRWKPLSAREVSTKIGADIRALSILFDALTALGFLTKQGESYQCPLNIAELLSDDEPRSILPMLIHTANLWHKWSRLTNTVKGFNEPDDASGYFRNVEETKAFIEAMHVIARPRASKIVAQINPGSARSLIDIGGASGTYTIAFLEAAPQMRATLFDKPEVIVMARERLDKAGMLDRVNLVPGDFYRDEFPPGHDLAFLSAIIHQNSYAENEELFKKTFDCLKKGGRIVVRDYVMLPDRTRPAGGAVFALNMLLTTPGGGTYTFEEIKESMMKAGFSSPRMIYETDQMDSLIEAFKLQ